jgi:hypothetical protein
MTEIAVARIINVLLQKGFVQDESHHTMLRLVGQIGNRCGGLTTRLQVGNLPHRCKLNHHGKAGL